jgi:hypothetical protein
MNLDRKQGFKITYYDKAKGLQTVPLSKVSREYFPPRDPNVNW